MTRTRAVEEGRVEMTIKSSAKTFWTIVFVLVGLYSRKGLLSA